MNNLSPIVKRMTIKFDRLKTKQNHYLAATLATILRASSV
jgi:hypothetical protein